MCRHRCLIKCSSGENPSMVCAVIVAVHHSVTSSQGASRPYEKTRNKVGQPRRTVPSPSHGGQPRQHLTRSMVCARVLMLSRASQFLFLVLKTHRSNQSYHDSAQEKAKNTSITPIRQPQFFQWRTTRCSSDLCSRKHCHVHVSC